ncbi:MAG TPA: O-antigen ligase family protein [Gaiellaceae bacterium]|nr:O-antigen ligase family protein [Gaiellaceae bacterium]
MRAAGERLAGPGSVGAAAAAAVCFCAVFFSGGDAEAPLVWIGALALLLAACLAGAAFLGVLPSPRVDLPAAVFLGCLLGLVAWSGASTFWSLSPDLSWSATNRTLVYAAFALAGVLVGGLRAGSAAWLARAAAVLLALVLGWALLAKCVPALYPSYGRQAGLGASLGLARLRSPVGYWNELALLGDVAVPVALWLAAPRTRRAGVRAAGAVLLFAAVLVTLLTYSRFGVALAVAAAVGWVVLDGDRVESLVGCVLGGGAAAAVFALALALPGITKDGQTRSVRAHDGWIFALEVLAAGAAVAAAAFVLARLEGRRPLGAGVRRRVERIAAVAALLAVLAGLAVSVAYAGRIWHAFTNPVSSQINSQPGRLPSLNSSNRWRWWTEEWHAFTRHPVGGTGAGTFHLTDLALRRSPLTTTEPHNVPLQFLGETGIVGLLLYLGAAAAAAAGIVRARGTERAAVTALGVGLAVFLAHMVADMDWNYVATTGPLLLAAGVLLARPAPAAAARPARRPLLAVGAALVALAGVYSLGAPWLAQRQLASATTAADAKRAHAYDPLSTAALMEWADFEDGSGHLERAEQLYRQAVSLEPENSETWWALGSFYYEQKAWAQAYAALSSAWTYNRYGPAGTRCGLLDQARHEALHVWPASCPGGVPAATP